MFPSQMCVNHSLNATSMAMLTTFDSLFPNLLQFTHTEMMISPLYITNFDITII